MAGRVAGTRNEEIFPIIFGMHWKLPLRRKFSHQKFIEEISKNIWEASPAA